MGLLIFFGLLGLGAFGLLLAIMKVSGMHSEAERRLEDKQLFERLHR